MKHKHADLIKAWADGAIIEVKYKDDEWQFRHNPTWHFDNEYRIKPISDVVRYYNVSQFGSVHEHERKDLESWDLEIYFDGETGELKSAKVIK
jgi:hypothetical protein